MYVTKCVNMNCFSLNQEQEEVWVSGRSELDAKENASKKFDLAVDEVLLEQDVDVLDTWFSSGLFPFSVFGWPDKVLSLRIKYDEIFLNA